MVGSQDVVVQLRNFGNRIVVGTLGGKIVRHLTTLLLKHPAFSFEFLLGGPRIGLGGVDLCAGLLAVDPGVLGCGGVQATQEVRNGDLVAREYRRVLLLRDLLIQSPRFVRRRQPGTLRGAQDLGAGRLIVLQGGRHLGIGDDDQWHDALPGHRQALARGDVLGVVEGGLAGGEGIGEVAEYVACIMNEGREGAGCNRVCGPLPAEGLCCFAPARRG
ncbi:hypothetical protein ABT187_24715 [Streptomyces sp. NPDC001817]|uniref:hypothetical protein n=1 Tax=Streptomyces sp. NPDC001817 TaxID=3154398 RepID=UPI00331F3BB0